MGMGVVSVIGIDPSTGVEFSLAGGTVNSSLAEGMSNSQATQQVGARLLFFDPIAGTWGRVRGDGTSLYTRPPPRAKTASSVTAGSTSSQQLFAANSVRSKVIVQNQDAAINVYVNIGATAVAGAGNIRIAPGQTVEFTGTSGVVNLIADSGTPAICAWEF